MVTAIVITRVAERIGAGHFGTFGKPWPPPHAP